MITGRAYLEARTATGWRLLAWGPVLGVLGLFSGLVQEGGSWRVTDAAGVPWLEYLEGQAA